MLLIILAVHLLGLVSCILASPIHHQPRRTLSIPLAKRTTRSEPRTAEQRLAELEAGVQGLYSKYRMSSGLQKRAGEVLLADLMSDM